MKPIILCDSPMVCFGENLSAVINQWITQNNFSSFFILADKNTAEACLPILVRESDVLKSASLCTVEAGEYSKSISVCETLWKYMLQKGADRQTLILGLGGGVIGDLGGFIASTFMRGVAYIQVPTSLLAMVDASIGGKTGINFEGTKNMIGTFQQPRAIFSDSLFLKTLPDDEKKSGFAEMVKHGLIEGGDHWEEILTTYPADNIECSPLLLKSIRLKLDITQRDFKESGLREVLNLGHTIAHALEALYLEKNLQLHHGFAVAAGILIEAELSFISSFGLNSFHTAQIRNYVMSRFPHVSFSQNEIDRLIELIGFDKKNKFGKVSFSLLKKPGDVHLNANPPIENIKKALEIYQGYA